MRRISLKSLLILVLSCFAIYFIIRYKFSDDNHENLTWDQWVTSTVVPLETTRIVLSFVVCENRLNASLNVVKSMLIFSKAPAHLVVFADDLRRLQLQEALTRWQNVTAHQFTFELHGIQFPEPADYWLNLFRKCAAQRLFFPDLLPNIDALIYVDTDTLFLGPAEELWGQFRDFNGSHIAGLALEDNNPNIAWYPRFAKHPYYGEFGVNSGVMLMNLTRMRQFGWMEYIAPVMRTWRDYLLWGDQDIINIILSHRTHAVRVLDCRYNYRSDQCAHGDSCAGAARGALLLHGSRGSFHKDAQPAFRACYEAIAEHQLGSAPEGVLPALEAHLARAPPSRCGALREAFLRVPRETLGAKHPALPER